MRGLWKFHMDHAKLMHRNITGVDQKEINKYSTKSGVFQPRFWFL